MTLSADATLTVLKNKPGLFSFLRDENIFLFENDFDTLKTKALGWFVGQSTAAFRPMLNHLVTNAILLEKATLHAVANDLDEIDPTTVDPSPKISIRMGSPRYYDSATKTEYSTDAWVLWCEEANAEELEQYLTTTGFDERAIGKFVPMTVNKSTANKFISAIQAQNDYLKSVRTIPVMGFHPKVMNAVFGREETIMDVILAATATDKTPLFRNIERTNTTFSNGRWLFGCSDNHTEEAQKFVQSTLIEVYKETAKQFASDEIQYKESNLPYMPSTKKGPLESVWNNLEFTASIVPNQDNNTNNYRQRRGPPKHVTVISEYITDSVKPSNNNFTIGTGHTDYGYSSASGVGNARIPKAWSGGSPFKSSVAHKMKQHKEAVANLTIPEGDEMELEGVETQTLATLDSDNTQIAALMAMMDKSNKEAERRKEENDKRKADEDRRQEKLDKSIETLSIFCKDMSTRLNALEEAREAAALRDIKMNLFFDNFPTQMQAIAESIVSRQLATIAPTIAARNERQATINPPSDDDNTDWENTPPRVKSKGKKRRNIQQSPTTSTPASSPPPDSKMSPGSNNSYAVFEEFDSDNEEEEQPDDMSDATEFTTNKPDSSSPEDPPSNAGTAQS